MRECDDTCTFDCGRCKGRVKRRLVIDVEVPKHHTHMVLHPPPVIWQVLRDLGYLVENISNEPRN